jgi:predicted nuclease of predicted toxin-antitoxin system
MSWRDNLRSTIESTSEKNFAWQRTSYDFEFLLAQIGDRDAVVDACLPPQLAEDLRRRNINAVWVPAILGDGVSDEEIERQLLIGEGLIWESRKKNKVLLTRDVKFFRKLRNRAILVRYRDIVGRSFVDSQQLKRELKNLQNTNGNFA